MSILEAAVVSILALPALATTLVILAAWSHRPLSELATTRVVSGAFSLAGLAGLVVLAGMISGGHDQLRVELGTWFEVAHYAFVPTLAVDRLSLPFALLSALLLVVISEFSRRYLHRERGFTRFYALLAMFGAGIELVVLADGIDLAFFGWELVGLSSALLIAFFQERPAPAKHGLWAFMTYRVCDIGLLAAAVWLHHTVGSTVVVEESAGWAGYAVPPGLGDAMIVGFLLLWASMGKAAQVPLGGWLPRAMEGPTPSSAIFYGALSIHLGPYLLLRAAPLLEAAPAVAVAVVLVGAATALHATFVGRVQTDIKSTLAYASMTQVGLIYVEIGFGLYWVAVVHIVGHMTWRTLQILRAPSLIHEWRTLEHSMGSVLPQTGGHLEKLVPARLQPWLYRAALERGYFDSLLRDHVVGRTVRWLRSIDRLEQQWIALLAGELSSPDERSEVELERRRPTGSDPSEVVR